MLTGIVDAAVADASLCGSGATSTISVTSIPARTVRIADSAAGARDPSRKLDLAQAQVGYLRAVRSGGLSSIGVFFWNHGNPSYPLNSS